MGGRRKLVYTLAADSCAHHYPVGESGIAYQEGGGSDDLLVRLCFSTTDYRHGFIVSMERFFHSSAPCPMAEPSLTTVHDDVDNFPYVLVREYEIDDDSASYVSSSGSHVSEAPPEANLSLHQSVNSPQTSLDLLYKCHIHGKALCTGDRRSWKKNESNTLAATWLFHQFFDGLNVRPGIPLVLVSDASAVEPSILLSDGKVCPAKPRAAEASGGGPEEIIAGDGTRKAVHLRMRFLSDVPPIPTVRPAWRRLSPFVWLTTVFVLTPSITKEALRLKAEATLQLWQRHFSGEVMPTASMEDASEAQEEYAGPVTRARAAKRRRDVGGFHDGADDGGGDSADEGDGAGAGAGDGD